MSKKQSKKLLTPEILKQALLGAVKKLDPRYMIKNPVMFVVEVGFFITLLLTIVPGRRNRQQPAHLQPDRLRHPAGHRALRQFC